MSPTPEKKKNSNISKKTKLFPNNLERTVDKYGQNNRKKVIKKNDIDSDSESEGREGQLNGNNNNNCLDDKDDDDDDDENDNINIGILNISNHDINDFDNVLQSDLMYATPINKLKSYSKTIKNHHIKDIIIKQSPRGFTPMTSPGFSTQKIIKHKNKCPLPSRQIEKIGKDEKNDKTVKLNKLDKNKNFKLDSKFMESVAENDLNDICIQIKMLNEELKYYEEITGKRSIFQRNVSTLRTFNFFCSSICYRNYYCLSVVVFCTLNFIYTFLVSHFTSKNQIQL